MSATSVAPARPDVRAPGESRPVVVSVAIAGVGRVGQAVIRVATRDRDRLRAAGVDLRFTTGLVRDPSRARAAAPGRLTDDPARLFDDRPDVVIETLGGADPARDVIARCLARRIPVVTANKTVIARHGDVLSRLAHRCRTPIAFEAAVVAGVPFVGALARRPLVAGATGFLGILNGTSNFVLSAIAAGASREAALVEAVARGYAEPDATADLGGRDAAEKLSILLRLAGVRVAPAALPARTVADIDRAHFALAEAVGGTLKPVAAAAIGDRVRAWVGPAFVAAAHPLSRVHGTTNSLTVQQSGEAGITFTGPGAGPEVTAATLIDDVVELARFGRHMSCGVRPSGPAIPRAVAAPDGPWFVAVDRSPFSAAHLSDYLTHRGLPVQRVETAGDACALLTWPVAAATVVRALDPVRALGVGVLSLPAIGAHDRG